MIMYHSIFEVNMDTSDEDDFALNLSAEKELKDLRKPK